MGVLPSSSYVSSTVWLHLLDSWGKVRWELHKKVAMLVQLYYSITRTLMKRLEKKLGWKYKRMLHVVLTNPRSSISKIKAVQPLISQIIQVRLIRHSGHCSRS